MRIVTDKRVKLVEFKGSSRAQLLFAHRSLRFVEGVEQVLTPERADLLPQVK